MKKPIYWKKVKDNDIFVIMMPNTPYKDEDPLNPVYLNGNGRHIFWLEGEKRSAMKHLAKVARVQVIAEVKVTG